MSYRTIVAIAAAAFAVQVMAQTSTRGDPADPNLRVPAVRYESALGRYQRFEEQKPGPWRELNDRMGALGGHEGHVKDDAKPAQEGNAASPSAPAMLPDPVPAPAAAPPAGAARPAVAPRPWRATAAAAGRRRKRARGAT